MNKIKLQIARMKFYYQKKLRIHLIYFLIMADIIICGYSYLQWQNEWKYQQEVMGMTKVTRAESYSPIRPALADGDFKIPTLTKSTTSIPMEYKVIIKAKGSLADRLNNPGNLMYAGQKNATKDKSGFAHFKTINDGFKALLRQIRIDQNRDLSVEQFITKYAPEEENDTENYIKQVATNLNIKPTTNISFIDTIELAREIIRVECGGYLE